MMATLIIETALVLYTLVRYNMTQIAKLVVLVLVGLATFQLSEYHVCTGSLVAGEGWSRLGYVAITLLPAVGLHMLYLLAGNNARRLVGFGYGSMAALMTYFTMYPAAFTGFRCTGNYVIFQIGSRPALVYSTYYYGLLLAALYLGVLWLRTPPQDMKTKISPAKRQAIKGLLVGYLIFLVPTALANSVDPATRQAIPSIMCGFAVLFAMILAGYILPRSGQQKNPI